MTNDLTSAFKAIDNLGDRIDEALELIVNYGGIDGGHHKQWLLDQVVRKLCDTEESYQAWLVTYKDGEDGPETYERDVGIAP